MTGVFKLRAREAFVDFVGASRAAASLVVMLRALSLTEELVCQPSPDTISSLRPSRLRNARVWNGFTRAA